MTVKTSLPKKSVLFLCTHNAVRSQMAEALLNKIHGDRYTAFSAGSDPSGLDPLVTAVMSEIGIDAGNQQSKNLDVFKNSSFNIIVTVCDQAKESCPFFPGAGIRRHKSFADPSEFEGTYEDKISQYRLIRDEIKIWIEKEFS
jgi:arsenate reductase (thioredoxin)